MGESDVFTRQTGSLCAVLKYSPPYLHDLLYIVQKYLQRPLLYLHRVLVDSVLAVVN